MQFLYYNVPYELDSKSVEMRFFREQVPQTTKWFPHGTVTIIEKILFYDNPSRKTNYGFLLNSCKRPEH